jgi:Dna[CI] antecedent, DciA
MNRPKRRRKKGPPRGEATIAQLVPKVYPTNEPDELRLVRAIAWWHQHAPRRIAQNSRPARLRGDALFIHTSTGAWAQELTLLLPRLSPQLCAAVPGIDPAKIRTRSGPLPPAPPPAATPAAPVPPLSFTQLPDAVARALVTIGDDQVRAAVASAAAQALARRRD